MAQGRPPRHSKTKRDPVTIDLEAEKGMDDSKAGTPEKTKMSADTSATAGTSTDATDASVSSEDRAQPAAPAEARETAPESTPAAEAAASSDSSADKVVPDEAAATGTAQSGKPFDRKADDKASEEPAREVSVAAEGERGTGRAFVAGLIGGIVAAIVFYALLATGTLPVPSANDEVASQTAGTIANLGSELDTLKQNVADLAAREPAAGDSDAAVAELKKQVAALSQTVDDLKAAGNQAGANSADVSGLRQTVSALQDTTNTLQDTTEQTGSAVASLSDRVNKIETELSKPSDEARLARSVAAIGLRSAIERGGPFDAELQAYQGVAPNDPAVETLKPVAADGIPSQRQLVARFPETADAILSATKPEGASSGVFDRLMSSARSLVKVRPTGNAEGNTPEAIVARMEVKLNAGDLKDVVAEWQALPEAGKQASQAFIDQVNQRLSALAAVDNILRETNRSASDATEDGQAQ